MVCRGTSGAALQPLRQVLQRFNNRMMKSGNRICHLPDNASSHCYWKYNRKLIKSMRIFRGKFSARRLTVSLSRGSLPTAISLPHAFFLSRKSFRLRRSPDLVKSQLSRHRFALSFSCNATRAPGELCFASYRPEPRFLGRFFDLSSARTRRSVPVFLASVSNVADFTNEPNKRTKNCRTPSEVGLVRG